MKCNIGQEVSKMILQGTEVDAQGKNSISLKIKRAHEQIK